ncbi:MAG: hypothetical protein FWD06_04190 [Oscillospiraceae bacterium]|nr:hypothetical protein [Oscillospiraceae bacterium]
MKTKQLERFDEREINIRNRVMVRGLYVLAGLLAIDYLLKAFSVHWAHGPWNNIIYVALAGSVIMVEFILRGVYFGHRDTPKTRLMLMLFVTAIWGFNIFMNLRLFSFAEYGQLTMDGATLIAFVLITLTFACGTVRAAHDLRKGKQAKE